MALIKKPVNGMKDILPDEMALRDYLISIIKSTYRSYGFSCMETPCVEHIENLLSKQGGDNEKLIFKILKRGGKLDLAAASDEADLVDGGLRYDLTLPLARYYSNNSASLPAPFKALQIGSVWRADRPQKGRFRQFTQCDIDILGDASNAAEIELILATTKAVSRICPDRSFKVRINDRRILKGMAEYAGFPEELTDTVFIILDKMDKIGADGVRRELAEAGCDECAIDRYMNCIGGDIELESIAPEAAQNLKEIRAVVEACRDVDFALVYDPTLVRGMGYYTGTIFEISMEGFGGSVGGGGRYDRMIGRFTGQETPACGFSIGFERIITILQDAGFKVPEDGTRLAMLYDKGIDAQALSDIMKEAAALRSEGRTVLVTKMNKNKKFQKEQLAAQGYTEFKEFYSEALKH